MLKADAAAVIGLCLVAALLVLTVIFVVSRWRGTSVQWRGAQPTVAPAAPTSTEWHHRLDELNFLLSRVQASDSTLAQLGSGLVDNLRRYFGNRLTPPPAPATLNAVINRVILLEDWLQEVQAARIAHQTLPAEVADQVDRYLVLRQQRLDS